MEKKSCAFCGRVVDKYIEGIEVCTCHECIDTLATLKIESEESNVVNLDDVLKPHEIKARLDEYIIGQDDAKKKLVVEVYNHYKRVNAKPSKNIDIPKNNMLIIGPSGCGKTYMLEKLSSIFDLPIAFGDANDFTASGYAGKDVETLLRTLIDKADGDLSKAERGIVYIDEIDKIAQKADEKDVGTTSVQQSLLTIINGTDYVFDRKTSNDRVPFSINTRNILFICSGAFDGLDKIIEKRISPVSSIGFNLEKKVDEDKDKKNILYKLETKDLYKFGLIKEFIGRLPLIAIVDKLSEEQLREILVKPKNSVIKQYQKSFKIDNIKIKFSAEALEYIAKQAYSKETGARGLKSVISEKMNGLLYELIETETTEYEVKKELFIEKESN